MSRITTSHGTTRRGVRALLVLALLAACLPAPGRAQTAAAPDELGRETPRGAALGYLEACRAGDYERAAR